MPVTHAPPADAPALSAADRAEQALTALRSAASEHADALDRLVALQRQRPMQKLEAEVRLCQQDHPATPGKRYSLSQAADVLQLDPAYAAYKLRVAETEAAAREAEDEKRICYLEVEWAIAAFKAAAGLA